MYDNEDNEDDYAPVEVASHCIHVCNVKVANRDPHYEEAKDAWEHYGELHDSLDIEDDVWDIVEFINANGMQYEHMICVDDGHYCSKLKFTLCLSHNDATIVKLAFPDMKLISVWATEYGYEQFGDYSTYHLLPINVLKRSGVTLHIPAFLADMPCPWFGGISKQHDEDAQRAWLANYIDIAHYHTNEDAVLADKQPQAFFYRFHDDDHKLLDRLWVANDDIAARLILAGATNADVNPLVAEVA
jgi:hypothetical protein